MSARENLIEESGEPLTLREVQRCCFHILEYIDATCKRENIPYCLVFGTALGSVRHHGFIPWDDDIDIAVLEEDYARFCRAIRESPAPYYKIFEPFVTEGYMIPHAKVFDSRTVFYESDNRPIEGLGVFVDICPLCGVASQSFIEKMRLVLVRCLFKAHCWMYVRRPEAAQSKVGWKRIAALVFQGLSRIMKGRTSLKFLCARGLRTTKEKDYICSVFGTKIHKKQDIFPSIQSNFCSRTFPIPNNYDLYLEQEYGTDYLTPRRTNPRHGEAFWKIPPEGKWTSA